MIPSFVSVIIIDWLVFTKHVVGVGVLQSVGWATNVDGDTSFCPNYVEQELAHALRWGKEVYAR